MIAMTTAVDGPAAAISPARSRTSGRHRAAAAWAMAVIVPVLAFVTVVLHVQNGNTDLTSWWYGSLTLAACLLVPGVLIARRRPANPIGWLLCVACLGETACAAGREYLVRGFLGATAPGWLWIGWLADSAYILAVVTLPVMLMLFPDGTALSHRWRLVLVLPAMGLLLSIFGYLFTSGLAEIHGRSLENPGAHLVPAVWPRLAADLGDPLMLISLLLAVVVLVLRYRRSRGEQRQQLKWMAWAGSITAIEVISEFVPGNAIAVYTSIVADALLAAAVAIAILRHRLLDIDVVINRTLVFAALTASLVLGYIGLVAAFDALAGQPVRLGTGLIATGLVALAFAPARNRVQRSVDRLMYGERKNPYGVITQLGRRLERSGEHGELTVVVDTVTQALKLPYAAIVDPEGLLLAESGQSHGSPHLEPLGYQGATVGQLVVEPRSGRGGFNRDERRLIADLARQVGAAVHAVRLSTDLQASRQRLVTAKEEERRRLRRDLHDGLGPKLAALALKLDAARTMVDHRPDQSKAVLSDVKVDIRATIDDIRQLVYGLRPPALDELGVVGALRECVARFDTGADSAPAIVVHAPDTLPQLPAAVEVAVYWIVNEAVTNVIRHASAAHCNVRLELAERSVLLTVGDDGIGLDERWRAGVGTSSMAERAAELGGSLTMRPPRRGSGTEVSVTIPLALPVPAP